MKPTLQKAAPHIRRGLSSRDVMLDVLIACLPMRSAACGISAGGRSG